MNRRQKIIVSVTGIFLVLTAVVTYLFEDFSWRIWGASSIGLLGGVLFRIFKHLSLIWQSLLTVVLSHIVASVVVKTFGLVAYYDMPLYVLMLWRLFNYAIVAPAEWALIYTLLKNQALRRRLEALRG